jgi:hypothetical protein
MLTLFTIPKPFRGHIGTIQRNAILSWKHLCPQPQIVLLGDEDGIADIALSQNLQHVPRIARNEFGTPLMSDAFAIAHRLAAHDILCYINADILLLGNFLDAVGRVARKFDKFLAVSRRVNVDIEQPIDFCPGWEAQFKENFVARGTLGLDSCIDAFVFPKTIFQRVPDFAIGRLWFDHWFIRAARRARLPVVELSLSSPLIHQNHDYNHVQGSIEAIWLSQESQRNLKLYGKIFHDYTLSDATHRLLPDGLIDKLPSPKRSQSIRYLLWQFFVQNTFLMRKRFGLRRESFRTLAARWCR